MHAPRVKFEFRASRCLRVLAAAAAVGVTAALAPGTASAGGFDIPDNGAGALGRGGAFVARADDGTAIYYNPAGLARQRGTRLFGGANLYFHSFEFQRAGSFPDNPNDTQTPWGGKPFPASTNTAGPSPAPFVALSTDFASLDRLTVALGAFSPPSVGSRTFPIGVQNAPASSRYDFVQSRSSFLFPTVSTAYRVVRWLDIGLSGHLVLASFDQTSVAYADVGQCVNREYQACDSRTTLAASATSFSATFGALLRPSPSLAFGLSVRMPSALSADGTITPQPPKLGGVQVASGSASLSTKLPLVARLGGRYVKLEGTFERYDMELDATYERWGAAQGDGPRIRAAQLGQFKAIDTYIARGYRDTVSVRAGGAYNFHAFEGLLSVRAGAYFDSSATKAEYTRVDVDTLAKVAGTFGLGYRRGAYAFDLAYAAVASMHRLVGSGQGEVRPLNPSKNGRPIANDGSLLLAVNEGAYRGFTHIVSLGITVTFDELFGPARPVHYGNPYEPGYVAPGEPRKKETTPEEEAKKHDPERIPDEPAIDPIPEGPEPQKPSDAPDEPKPEKEKKKEGGENEG